MSTQIDKTCPKTPRDAGLPERFDEWRSNQMDFINKGLSTQQRITGICAPTGFGKQVCAAAIAVVSQKPTCIVVPNLGLQDQYMSLGIRGMVDLRGRKNYKCSFKDDPDYSCEQGYAGRCPYRGSIMCESSQAEIRASLSPIVVTSYDKWTSSKMFGMGMQHFKQVIFDEGHFTYDALSKALQVQLHHKEIEETLEVPFLDGEDADNMREWKLWAVAVRAIAEEKMIEARRKMSGVPDPKASWVRHYLHMKNLVKRLGTISTCAAKDWVVEQVHDGYTFDAIRPGRYVESHLLLHVPRVISISATNRPKTMYMTGIGRDKFDFTEYPSDFDPRRGPIYWVPTMRVQGQGQDLSMLWLRLDQFASRRRSVKGLVHTVSYERQKQILARSRFADSMLINERGEPTTETVDDFKQAGPGAILVSPSIGMGYDFPDDECRWTFVCKVPFEPPSKILKARQEDDKDYRFYRAMQSLVQAFGRDVRSKTDWSERVIGDDQIEWFAKKYAHFAPKSFKVNRVELLPAPLNL